MVDVPICFKKSRSLKTKNFELPLLKFSNLLMRKGKKDKIIRIIFNSIRLFLNSNQNPSDKSFIYLFF
jgi:ribosomal protein S7